MTADTHPEPISKDDLAAEAVAEVRGILADLRRRGEEHRHFTKETSSRLERLAYLLGLSPAERAFVQEAAEANRSGDPLAADTALAIFADWLEDEGRTEDGKRVRRLLLEDGDVMILVAHHTTSEQQVRQANQAAMLMQEAIRKAGKGVLVRFIQEPEQSVERLGREQMRQAGWVRQEEQEAIFRELAGTLEGQPESRDGGLTTDLLVRMIDRLKRENKRLRFRLNHQTDEDVEECRQGKHPPDCGA